MEVGLPFFRWKRSVIQMQDRAVFLRKLRLNSSMASIDLSYLFLKENSGYRYPNGNNFLPRQIAHCTSITHPLGRIAATLGWKNLVGVPLKVYTSFHGNGLRPPSSFFERKPGVSEDESFCLNWRTVLKAREEASTGKLFYLKAVENEGGGGGPPTVWFSGKSW